MGTVYILKSLRNGRYYIGSTVNIDRRLHEHNSGKSTYTKLSRPFELVFRQNFDSLVEAKRIEYKIKRLKSRAIIERIVEEGFIRLAGT